MCASSLFVMQIKWTILKVEVKYNDKAVVASYRLQILRHVLLQIDENAISLPVSGADDVIHKCPVQIAPNIEQDERIVYFSIY